MKGHRIETKDRIKIELEKGLSYRKVAEVCGVSKSTVHRIAKNIEEDLPKCKAGAPSKLTDYDKRKIVRLITSDQCDTAAKVNKELQKDGTINVCTRTIQNALRSSGLRAAPKVKKPLLSKRHIKARLDFAKRHQHWTIDDWNRVIWSDETKINRLGSDGRKWCWKKAGEGLKPRHVNKTVKHGGGNIKAWGCMTAHGVGYLTRIDNGLDADLYCRILEEELVQSIEYYGLDKNKIIFQHDNDPKHTSRKATQNLRDLELEVLEWPAQSPDLNPIEHLWEDLKRSLAKYETQPKGMTELWERVEAEWNKISIDTCRKLIDSMPNRIEAVLKAKGGYTKY